MRRLLVVAFALLPVAAFAELHEGNDWRNCASDADCIAIQGKCGLTAVNIGYRNAAADYYKQEAANTKCTEQFWKPKAELPRCRLGQCETIPKQAGKSK